MADLYQTENRELARIRDARPGYCYRLLAATLLAAYLVYRLLELSCRRSAWALAFRRSSAHPINRRVSRNRIGHHGVAARNDHGRRGSRNHWPGLIGGAADSSSQKRSKHSNGSEEDKLANGRNPRRESANRSEQCSGYGDNVNSKARQSGYWYVYQRVTSWSSGTVWLVVQLFDHAVDLFFFLRDK